MIPAMFESTANNVASGMMTAANHGLLGAATHISQAAYVAADTADGGGGVADAAGIADI